MLVAVDIERTMRLNRHSPSKTELCPLLGSECETVLSVKLRYPIGELKFGDYYTSHS